MANKKDAFEQWEIDLLESFKGAVKPLPRDSEGKIKRAFMANDKKYLIWDWADGIPIERWHIFKISSLMLQFNATPGAIQRHIEQTNEMLNDIFRGSKTITPLDIMQRNKSMIEGIISDTQNKYPKALYQCTIFILREGENLAEFNHQTAIEKIEDWRKEGLGMTDFLAIAARSLRALDQSLTRHMESGSEVEGKDTN